MSQTGTGDVFEAGGRSVQVTRPDKVLFPESGSTKRDLAAYYRAVAETMLPHLRDRPLVMQRFPDGLAGEGFFEKRVPDSFPSWIRRAELPTREGGTIAHLVCDDAASLVYLAGQACITPHAWLARADRPEHPDRMVFDLDPPGEDPAASYPEVRWAARRLREVLDELGLPAFVMSTGSRGLHVAVPLEPAWEFDAVRTFARRVADRLARRYPDRLTTAQRKEARGKALFIDVLRNAYGQTAVAPYAVRTRPGAPVAAPLDWDELGTSGMHPRRYTVRNLMRRLGRRTDPWAAIAHHATRLDDADARLRRERASAQGGPANGSYRRREHTMPRRWSAKDERQYEHVKESEEERGRSPERAKEIAARTVNKQRRSEGRTPQRRTQGTGNPNAPLESRSVDELYNRARELGIDGRSRMRKGELIRAIRSRE